MACVTVHRRSDCPELQGGEVGEVFGDGGGAVVADLVVPEVEGGEVGKDFGHGVAPSSPIWLSPRSRVVRLGRCSAMARTAVVADLVAAEVEGGEGRGVFGDGGAPSSPICWRRGRGW